MKVLHLLLFLACMGFGCSSIRGIKLPTFSYNNRYYNSLIVNRVPDYGDGHRDGCLVLGQIYLSMASSGGTDLYGEIRDVKTMEPLSGATLKVFSRGTEAPLILQADEKGRFNGDGISHVQRIEAFFIGYRTLIVDVSEKKLL